MDLLSYGAKVPSASFWRESFKLIAKSLYFPWKRLRKWNLATFCNNRSSIAFSISELQPLKNTLLKGIFVVAQKPWSLVRFVWTKPEFLDLAVAIHPQVRGPDWCSGNNICWWQYPHCWKCANSVTVVGHEHYLKVFTVFICQQRRCPILSCSAKLCQCTQCHWMWQLRREGVFYQVMAVPSCYVSHHLLPACLLPI